MVQRLPVELSIHRTGDGRRPFAEWFQHLADRSVQARVMQRLDRLQTGNPGDCKPLGAGLLELRVDVGPGYRVYFAWLEPGHCIILWGGSKRTQVADIARARKWLEEARRRPRQ
jgi:putative addiction module killer protein